jgi:hypothetical protein
MHRGRDRVVMLRRAMGPSVDSWPGLPGRGRRTAVAAALMMLAALVGFLVPAGAEPLATGALLTAVALGVGVLSSWSP